MNFQLRAALIVLREQAGVRQISVGSHNPNIFWHADGRRVTDALDLMLDEWWAMERLSINPPDFTDSVVIELDSWTVIVRGHDYGYGEDGEELSNRYEQWTLTP